MTRCTKCGFPDTRPGLFFVDGVCGACINYEKRKTIDWKERRALLHQLCGEFRGKTQYDCLIPVSGGKDSHMLVYTMVKEEGMNPLLVTVTDSFTHTKAGTHNLRNMIEKFNVNHYQYTISHDLFKRATRIAFEDTGEALKFVEYAIYTIPFTVAQMFNIPLVVFGENSAYEYGTTERETMSGNHAIKSIVDKMYEEKPWWERRGVTWNEIKSIMPPISNYDNPRLIFMSYFKPWSSVDNLAIAKEWGFHDLEGEWERKGTVENFEQIDSMAYMIHLWIKYPKFGFQRAADIISRRVREGTVTLEEAYRVYKDVDPCFDEKALKDFCDTLGYSYAEFWEIVGKWDRTDTKDEFNV
jgi:N-acetyl sugar amidotransferase